jgi:hypothetical protein
MPIYVIHVESAVHDCLQAFFVLPWRWALLMQLVNSAAVLSSWSTQLPCLLQAAQLQPNNATELFYQPQATDACETLQYASGWLRAGFGDVTGSLMDQVVCQGLQAVQALQAFATIVFLAVLPVLVLYALEWHYKLQFLRSLAPAHAAAAAGGFSEGSDSNSSSNGIHQTTAASSGSRTVVERNSDGHKNEPVAAVVLQWLVCVAAVLSCSWLLAEVLVTVSQSRKHCPASTY